MKNRILLSAPHMGGAEQKYLNKAFQGNWIAPAGPNLNEFEYKLCKYTGAKHSAALNSGTSAIHLALKIVGVGKDDEVLCSTLTFVATANPIKYLGAIPIFIDSESESMNMDPYYLEKAIKEGIRKGKKPKAILLAHICGMCGDLEKILTIGEKFNIPLIEDAAEALGSKYKGKYLGTFGEIGIYSFNGNKIITTSAGGALISNNSDHVKKAIFYSTHAKEKAEYFQHEEVGFNYRMSNICAGIGIGQLEVIDNHLQKRRSINMLYRDVFSGIEGVKVVTENNDTFANYWLSTVIIDQKRSSLHRDELKSALAKEYIDSRLLWKPLHLQPLFKNCLFFGNGTSEYLFRNGLSLPSGSIITEKEKERIKIVLLDYINSKIN